MSTTDLIIGMRDQAAVISQRGPLHIQLPTQQLDPIDDVSFAKLLVFVTGSDYDTVVGGFVDLTPDQPDADPMDLDNLLAQVIAIPKDDVTALAGIQDDQLALLAEKWCAIEEFKHFNFVAAEMQDELFQLRAFARQCVDSQQDLLMRLST